MRLTRLRAALVAVVVLAGVASCATTIDGNGSIASDVVTEGPTPTGSVPDDSDDPTPESTSGSPTPQPSTPTPTVDPVKTRELALCVLERASIAGINTRFNASKKRDEQLQILRQGATTIRGQLARSGLPGTDPVRRAGTNVYDQLVRLYTDATGGNTPSTKAYNVATQNFQKACNSIS